MRHSDNYRIPQDFGGCVTKEMENQFVRMLYRITEKAKDFGQAQSQHPGHPIEIADQSQQAIIFIWHVAFLKEPVNPWFLLFCLLAFNSAVYLSLQAGNVCIIEQVALWTAFHFYMRNRLILFSIFLVMAAIFKWYPLFFGGLIALCSNGRRLRAFASLGAVLLLVVFMTWIIDQRLFTQYVSAVQKIVRFTVVQGDDTFNLAAWPLINAWPVMLGQDNWIERPVVLPWFLFLLWAGTVTSLSWKAIRNPQLSEEEDLTLAINVRCLVFALLSLRFQDYYYILL